jgi:hypothetical protein
MIMTNISSVRDHISILWAMVNVDVGRHFRTFLSTRSLSLELCSFAPVTAKFIQKAELQLFDIHQLYSW